MALRDKTRTRKTYSFFRTTPVFITFEDEAVGSGSIITVTEGTTRGSYWWADSSSDVGELDGSHTIHSGTFTSLPDRVNLWSGNSDSLTTLPLLGAGDHNRIVGYLEASNSNNAHLDVHVPTGPTRIRAGDQQNMTLYTVRGPGAMIVFRYDETIDCYILVDGGLAQSGQEVRHVTDTFDQSSDCSLSLTGSVTNNATGSNIGPASILSFNAVSNDFHELTGISAGSTTSPQFSPRKYLYNFSTGSVVIRFNDTRSSSGNRFIAIGSGETRALLPPNGSAMLQLLPGLGWLYEKLGGNIGIEVRRGVQSGSLDWNTANQISTDGELVRFNPSGGPVSVDAPAYAREGQKFGVMILTGGDVSVNVNPDDGFFIEDPWTGINSSPVVSVNSQGETCVWIMTINEFGDQIWRVHEHTFKPLAIGRDPQFWANSSTVTGMPSGDPDILQSGDFVSDPDRINLWNGGAESDNTTGLPAFGVGDHNRVIGYFEGSGSPTSALIVSRSGSTGIETGEGIFTSLTLRGSHVYHMFRYDERIDKFVLLHGASSLAGQEIRSRADSISGYGNGVVFNISASLISDATIATIDTAGFIILQTSAGAFSQLGGIDASAQFTIGFSPRKVLWNLDDVPIVLLFNSTSSNYPFSPAAPSQRTLTLQPSTGITVYWAGSAWFVVNPPGEEPNLAHVVYTTNFTGSTGELSRVNAVSNNITMTAPSASYPGQSFGIKRLDNSGQTVTVNASPDGIQDPATFGYPGSTITIAGHTGAVWFWDESIGTWLVRP